MNDHSILIVTFYFLAAAVFIVPLFKKMGLSSALGYLTAGAALGPFALGIISNTQSIMHFGELGVVLLLFVIGLELQPSRLWALRRTIFGIGTLQVLITTLVLFGLSLQLGVAPVTAAIAAFGLTLSSTPFALQLLGERNELTTGHGRTSFGILLFQDLAAIPVLALLPLLGDTAPHPTSEVTTAMLRAVLTIVALIASGRLVLRPLFRAVAKTRQREVFTASVLFVVLGTALAMQFAGLSMELGAFIAGVVLADSEYRHAIEADIEPFKGLLMGLFFMAIGMTVNFTMVLSHPLTIAGYLIGFMAVKYVVLRSLGRATGLSPESARSLAATLPQGGEFAFVLFTTATAHLMMDKDTADMLSLTVAISLAVTPLLMNIEDRLKAKQAAARKQPYDAPVNSGADVIVAGFGRVGQIVTRLLRIRGISFTALDHNAEQVDVVRRFGGEAYYGDASRYDLLEAAGAKRAKIFVLAIDDIDASLRTASTVREHFPHLEIFARARNRQHTYELMELGITRIFRETLGTSLDMSTEVLIHTGVAPEKARSIADRFRRHDELMLKEQKRYTHDETKMIGFTKQAAEQLIAAIRADEE